MLTKQTITNRHNQILFEGHFRSFSLALEAAIQDKVDLTAADLKHHNLQNITLDDAKLRRADFTGANLTGANMSEADLSHAYFTNADLYNTCFAYSDLSAAAFAGAQFGGTDITGADLSRARFDGLSCFDLNFITAGKLDQCIYINPDHTIKTFSQAPIVIKGYDKPIVMMDDDPVKTLSTNPFFIHLIQQQANNNSTAVE